LQTDQNEYGEDMIQHTEIVYNNTITRPEISKIEKQIFHRPRLSKKAVSSYRRWTLAKIDQKRSVTRKNGDVYNPDGSIFIHAASADGSGGAGNKINITKER
jgi:hypothetical protein